jgi:DNA-binding NarL/FixJ family response regulator
MNLLIVEDHPLVQESLHSLAVEGFPGAEITLAGSLADALSARERPYLVLLDLGLPDSAGLDTLKRWRRARPEPRVVVLAEADDAQLAQAAIQGGASGFVPKTHTRPMIAAALQLVVAGGLYMPARSAAERRLPVPRTSADLTERQLDVLRLISRGLRNREIGERLKISEETVKQHARVAYAILGVSSRTQAMSAVARRGIRLD